MTTSGLDADDALRRRTEREVESVRRALSWPTEPEGFLRDLKSYQLELETQSAELREERERTVELSARVSDLYDNAPLGYLTLDERGSIQLANRMAMELLDAPLDDLRNQLLADFVTANHRESLDRFIVAAFSDSAGASTAVKVVSAKGAVRLCQLDVVTSGRATTCRVTITDLTRKMIVEASQGESDRLAAAVFDSLSANIAVISENGTLLKVNANWSAFSRAAGAPETSVGVGSNYFDVCEATQGPDRELARTVAKGVHDVMAGRIREFQHEYPCHAPKRKQWFVLRATRCAGPGPSRTIITHQDVTARVELEAQLIQSQKMETLGQLTGGIAHDFNNLLTVINGGIELASQDNLSPERVRAELAHVALAGTRAAQLTSQLLAFSRKQMQHFEVLDVRDRVQSMHELLRRIIGDEIRLVMDLPSEPAMVSADASKLEHVVMNLVVNSRDAMPGGGTITIEVRHAHLDEPTASRCSPSLHEGAYVVVTVLDTGSGIDGFDLPHVFEPFYTTKPEGLGTGLGLSTVYGVVAQCGGGIVLESVLGEGTSVGVYLPLVSSAQTRRRQHSHHAPIGGTGETVLVVEDDSALNALIARVLTRYGYVTLTAASASEAIELLRERAGAIDLVFIDVVLPGMSGPDLAPAAQERWPRLRVLFSSGASDSSFPRTLSAHGDASFIPKPWVIPELLERVREALDTPVS